MKLFRKKDPRVSEQELIKGCVAGERQMQRLLYDCYATSMNRVCMRYARTSFEAEDLLHDAFMKVFSQIGKFNQNCPLEAWIRKIVVNTALTHHRKQSRRNELAEVEIKESLTDLVVPIEEQSGEELLELVQRLPPKYKVVLNLHAIEGYSHKEISKMLQQPEATTRSQYLRARLILQEMIIKEQSHHEKGRI